MVKALSALFLANLTATALQRDPGDTLPINQALPVSEIVGAST